jgi:hypothetical protein
LIETLSVCEAREQLPSVLERFRNGDRTTVQMPELVRRLRRVMTFHPYVDSQSGVLRNA